MVLQISWNESNGYFLFNLFIVLNRYLFKGEKEVGAFLGKRLCNTLAVHQWWDDMYVDSLKFAVLLFLLNSTTKM